LGGPGMGCLRSQPFRRFVVRATLVFAKAVIVCRTAGAAPAKPADRAAGAFVEFGPIL